MRALLEKPNKYIQAEEYLETHRGRRGKGKEEQGKWPHEILHEIKDNEALKWPEKMRSRATEVLFYNAFKKMNIPTDRLEKMDMPLYGFSNPPVAVEGVFALPVAIGILLQANLMLDFVVGVGEVTRDQTVARQCYVTSCQAKNKEVLIIKDLRDNTKMQRGKPAEDLISIKVYPEDETKTIRIGSNLKEDTKLKLIDLLRAYADIFGWTTSDMPGINPEVIKQLLKVDRSKKPFKQKKRTFALERQEKLEKDVDKLLVVGFIKEIHYLDWIANVVMVPKSGGRCFQSFIHYERGLYYYKVVPFNLKNAEATYQHPVNMIFCNMTGKNMEVYVDDMLVMSVKADLHAQDHKETFDILKKFKMKLNLLKCAFRVALRKFLGFMVSQRGIEANPKKIKAV
ncbi:hypothetical protein RJ639_040466 [Escallonia herrerae]|uniref:Reverse transcriptase domain-containing protein n=1 Tax=Escallonia herrerae TaxID=1293975 RepID=A0AA88WFW5_9ASTE|nr:hypothetical protein RJ639_040466 [Escallonia herrerae]